MKYVTFQDTVAISSKQNVDSELVPQTSECDVQTVSGVACVKGFLPHCALTANFFISFLVGEFGMGSQDMVIRPC